MRDTMPKSKKQNSTKSKHLAPLTLGPTQHTMSPKTKVLPKPETPFRTEDGEPLALSVSASDMKPLPKSETPSFTNDGGNPADTKLSSQTKGENGEAASQVNSHSMLVVSTSDPHMRAKYQWFHQHRGVPSAQLTPSSDIEMLPELETSFLTEYAASRELPTVSGDVKENQDTRTSYLQKSSFGAHTLKVASDKSGMSSGLRMFSIRFENPDQLRHPGPSGLETAQRETDYQSPSSRHNSHIMDLSKNLIAIEYTGGHERAAFTDISDRGQGGSGGKTMDEVEGRNAAKQARSKKDDDKILRTGSSPSTPRKKPKVQASSSTIQDLESALKSLIAATTIATMTDEENDTDGERRRKEAQTLLKMSPRVLKCPQITPDAWATKAVQVLDHARSLPSTPTKKPKTTSNPINEPSPLLMHDISDLETQLRRALATTSRSLDSEKKRGFDTSALQILFNKLKTLVERSPRFLTSPMEPEEWTKQAVELLYTTDVSGEDCKPGCQTQSTGIAGEKTIIIPLRKDVDATQAAAEVLADIKAAISREQNIGDERTVPQDPGRLGLISKEEWLPAPSSPGTLGQRTPSQERAGRSLSPATLAKSHDDIKRLAALLGEMAKTPAAERQADDELRKMKNETLDKDGKLKAMSSETYGQEPESNAARALTKMGGQGQVEVQEQELEDKPGLHVARTGAASVKPSEIAIEKPEEDVKDQKFQEDEESKLEKPINESEEKQHEETEAQHKDYEEKPVAKALEIRRKYSILRELFTEEELSIGTSF